MPLSEEDEETQGLEILPKATFFLIECFLFNVNKSAKESKGLYYENIEAFRHQVKKVQRRVLYKMTFVHH